MKHERAGGFPSEQPYRRERKGRSHPTATRQGTSIGPEGFDAQPSRFEEAARATVKHSLEGLKATHPARRGSPVGGWMDPDMQRTAIRQAERPVASRFPKEGRERASQRTVWLDLFQRLDREGRGVTGGPKYSPNCRPFLFLFLLLVRPNDQHYS